MRASNDLWAILLVTWLVCLGGRSGVAAWSSLLGFKSCQSLHQGLSYGFQSAQQPADNAEGCNATQLIVTAGTDKNEQLLLEAEELRLKAKKLMAEALLMEADLKESRSGREMVKKESSTGLSKRLFDTRPLTPEAVAQEMKNQRVSDDQAHLLVEQLFSELIKLDPSMAILSVPLPAAEAAALDSTNASKVATNAKLVFDRLNCFIEAAGLLDQQDRKEMKNRWSGRVASSLRSLRSQLRRAAEFKNVHATSIQQFEMNKANTSQNTEEGPVETVTKPVFMNNTTTYDMDTQISRIPPWLPPRLLVLFGDIALTKNKSLNSSSEEHLLSSKDVELIKQKVLTESRFVCTSSEAIPSAAIFRGTIRAFPSDTKVQVKNLPNRANMRKDRDASTSGVYRDLMRAMKKEGLTKRVQLFFMTDPVEPIDVEEPSPVVIAIPSSVQPISKRGTFFGKLLGNLSLVLTAVTLFVHSVGSYALNSRFFHAITNRHDVRILSVCEPVFWGILGIQILHEVVHLAIAKHRGIKIGWPLPLPSFELGSFGCITSLKSFPENRNVLFDFSFGGPVSAALSSLFCMIVGIQKSVHASAQALASFPVVPVVLLKSSCLVGSLLTALAPKIMSLPLSQPIPVHPLFVIGFSGLMSSALNFLPIFRLDGGRACDAAMGPRYGEFASATTLMFLVSAVLSKGSTPLVFTWFLFILMFQRDHEIPSRDEVTEISRVRFGAWLVALAFSILSIVPFPGYKHPDLGTL